MHNNMILDIWAVRFRLIGGRWNIIFQYIPNRTTRIIGTELGQLKACLKYTQNIKCIQIFGRPGSVWYGARSRASLLGGCIILIPARFIFISSLPKSVPHETSKWIPTCPYIFTNMHFWPCPSPMVTLTPIQGIYYSKFLLRAWQRIKMVWKLAHQVKLERDQGNWIPG